MTVFFFRKPSAAAVRAFIYSQSKLELSYAAVGATATEPPAGHTVDHTRLRLGQGRSVFDAAAAALRRWQHFQLDWVEPCWPETPIEPGQTVGILGCACWLWTLNACRIVYVVNEDGPIKKFGFAYGTLPEHVESGEERFAVEWHQADDSVWYDILAFSRPNHILARVGYPMVRRMQKRFARDSAAAMVRAVDTSMAKKSGAEK